MINNFNLNDYPLWTALVTPFTDTGEVDYGVLEQLVTQQQTANNGILLLGSTGEGLA
ncbi:dihydrodipicolinate synthase family protein, partial [Salmonella sp. ZJHZ20_0162]|uniref:dihydrodipicolinate synthase family protein n=1 Tax=Salmonella sp. ZJHZ20_0162 TaxID=3159595 RepID=UPI00397A3CEB